MAHYSPMIDLTPAQKCAVDKALSSMNLNGGVEMVSLMQEAGLNEKRFLMYSKRIGVYLRSLGFQKRQLRVSGVRRKAWYQVDVW